MAYYQDMSSRLVRPLFIREFTTLLLAPLAYILLMGASNADSIEPSPKVIVLGTEEVSNLVENLHQSQILLQKIIMNYHLFSAKGSDPIYNMAIETHTQSFAGLQASLIKTLKEKDQITALDSVQSNWKTFKKQLDTNRQKIAKKRKVDIQLTDNMMASAEKLEIALTNTAAEVTTVYDFQTRAPIIKARELSIIMQQLATHYAGRSSSSFGVSQRAQENEKTIDVLAKEFSYKLDMLAKNKGNNIEVTALFNKVSSKWRFIEKPLENYTESSIPFLITRYSDHIITALQKIASLYQ